VNTLSYLLRDALGSVDAITDSAGAVTVRESFGAFGQRRGTAWSGAPSSGELATINGLTRRGYTGHEMLDSTDLIHMNGRVYDPFIARFVSADPFVDGALNTQGWNRLGYVGNNPLTAVDPSGFSSRISARPHVRPYNSQHLAEVQIEIDASGMQTVMAFGRREDFGLIESIFRILDVPRPGGGSNPDGVSGGGGGSRSDNPEGALEEVVVKGDRPQEQKPNSCGNAANAPKGLAATNKAFRNNNDPNKRFAVDASRLTVKQTGPVDSRGFAPGVVQGGDWFVHGSVTLQQRSNGSMTIAPEQYNFEQHDASRYSPTWRGHARNVGTYFGFYVATYGGLSEYWADLTVGNHATDFTFDFVCTPTVVK
jgi:RHS repeat-associated protein